MEHATPPGTRTAYTAAVFLSAFLLFAVQPMFAKMVLPELGGAPAVWAVSLCFFQVLLLAGYCYAHLLESFVGPRVAVGLHLAVLAVALAALPITPPVVSRAAPPEGAYLWLIGVLAMGVGLPFFALSANAPLLQAWFGRSRHAESADAYFLYAASNAGSLAALLLYPFAIEPMLPLNLQSRAWTVLYVALAGAIAVCGAIVLRAQSVLPHEAPASTPRPAIEAARPWAERFVWASLAFVPSGLLVAFTTFVTTDIAAVPLFWVLPLCLYLATFILAFRSSFPVSRKLLVAVQPFAAAATVVTMDWDATFAWAISCLAGIVAFAVTCMICHRQLYERRPEPERLTDFYLWLSIGGAVGGVFSALIAPRLFTNLLELPLLLGLGLLCQLGWRDASAFRGFTPAALAAGLAAVVAALAVARWAPIAWTPGLRFSVLLAVGAIMVLTWRWVSVQLTAAAALVLGALVLPNGNTAVHIVRSFFGTHRVVDPPGGYFRILLHGTTLHGAERTIDLHAKAGSRPLPLTYHHPTGPLAKGVLLARAAAGSFSHPLRVGIVGLGAGAMACHSRPGDHWRFFEIDPEVVKIAKDPTLFSYISACQPEADFIVGDARLTLAADPEASFDYLAMDAFSSDAVPVHLLTVEALRLYARLLSDRGVLALNVSNQHLDLPPIVESGLAQIGGLSGVYAEGESGRGAIRSQVILIAKHPEIIEPALAWHNARRLGQPTVPPWTDNYSNILSPLVRRYRAKLSAG